MHFVTCHDCNYMKPLLRYHGVHEHNRIDTKHFVHRVTFSEEQEVIRRSFLIQVLACLLFSRS